MLSVLGVSVLQGRPSSFMFRPVSDVIRFSSSNCDLSTCLHCIRMTPLTDPLCVIATEMETMCLVTVSPTPPNLPQTADTIHELRARNIEEPVDFQKHLRKTPK